MTLAKPIRVAFLMDYPVPYRERTFERFADLGMDLTVYYSARRVPGRDWAIASGNYRQHDLPGVSFGAWFYLNPSIVREIRTGRFDALVVYGYSYLTAILAVITARICGIPVIMRSESTLFDHTNRNRSRPALLLKRFILTLIFKFCDFFAPSGTAALEYLLHFGAGVNRCHIVPTACDVEAFAEISVTARSRRKEERRNLGISEDALVYVYSGRLIPLKQVDKLIEAFRLLKKVHSEVALLIVGDGPQRSALQTQAGEIEDVYFVGFQPQDQLPRYYGISDVFVFPSEGDVWGVVVNEAMACGLPVISNGTVGAVPDMVRDGVNGIVTQGSGPRELLTAMEQLVSDRKRLEVMGAASRSIVSGWTHIRAATAFRELVGRALGGNQ